MAPRPGLNVLDVGCGTGELTALVHQRLGASRTLGVDSSRAMLERARAFAGNGVWFEERDAGVSLPDGPFDVVFSNAAIHWIPDHPGLLKRLTALLARGGQLAVQVPDMEGHPTHAVADEVAAEEPYRALLTGFARSWPVLSPEAYASLLFDLGYVEQNVRLQIYPHRLPSRESLVEWVKGTLLTIYERHLPTELWSGFVARYRELLFTRIPDRQPILYPYRRILFWGHRAEP